jgi:hypothetical protein
MLATTGPSLLAFSRTNHRLLSDSDVTGGEVNCKVLRNATGSLSFFAVDEA